MIGGEREGEIDRMRVRKMREKKRRERALNVKHKSNVCDELCKRYAMSPNFILYNRDTSRFTDFSKGMRICL